ncbi:threonine synthase [Philodulcilactobacillus myokoensis]|uniref:Threonine synthase n=1 Tax=Philodulcilactobacillus myokoensis TaxID=2929573 RepID=A0A9W6B204_9LACO|nr:threonine synthase [Philodulcilactobacillus myokoensis]GLB47479.1 threonine synthase [Philodulcilactobacillus myokoensis]
METQYTSTRNSNVHINTKEAIVKGFSDDNGLFVLPHLSDHKINLGSIMKQDYQGMAAIILQKLLPDFSATEIKQCLHDAYDHSFDTKKITPLVQVDNFHVLELFHGPTSAFKDVGLQLLPQLMKHALKPEQRVMILAATSGDTGTAALAGFKNTKQMGITVFYPHGGVSPIQQQQMLTTKGNNTNVASIKGNFDDAQTNVKKIFNNQNVKKQIGKHVSLSSANSINIGRLIPQIVYYFSAYQQLIQSHQIQIGDQINFTVPTGNFGDILAGYYAKKLGLPIKKLVIACNANNVLADFFHDGVYNRNRKFYKTVAPSMDIQVSSNFERLLYYKSGENAEYVKQLMDDLSTNGQYRVSKDVLNRIKQDFSCGFSDDRAIEDSIKTVYQKYHYLMDPHTAAGYQVMRKIQKQDSKTPMILLSTASPYKFVSAVSDAILGHHDQSVIQTTKNIYNTTKVKIPNNLTDIWDLPIAKSPVIEPNAMSSFVVQKVSEVFSNDQN